MILNLPRKRPYLVVTYTKVPQKGQQTQKKNWSADGVWDVNENMVIVDALKSKHESSAHVIVDLLALKVHKNRFTEITDTECFSTYVTKYIDDIKAAMANWGRRDPANQETLREFSAALSSRLAVETPVDSSDAQSDSN